MINLDEILLNHKRDKSVYRVNVIRLLPLLHLYYKQYETKQINKINFNLIHNFFINIDNYVELRYIYMLILLNLH